MIINIGSKKIGDQQSAFIIAEAGVNHNGNLEIAKKLVDAACEAGADAIKFQTFTAETLVTKTAEQADYQRQNIGKSETQFEMLKRLELKKEYHYILKEYSEEKGIIFLSSPFSIEDVDFLESLSILAYKIPSGEINNFPYLESIAKKNKPMIVATGMSTMAEIKKAEELIRSLGNEQLIFLHCTSNYPASPESLNMSAILTMKKGLNSLVGYSDHSVGFFADIIATSLGSCLIEKHFTLDKNMEGPDHKASLNPTELKEMVKAIRITESMLGNAEKRVTEEEENTKQIVRKSVVTRKDVQSGAIINYDDVVIKRPAGGIPPEKIQTIIGKKATHLILADTLIKNEDIN